MGKRPALTDDTFLRHLFSPKKNALPTGIRARPIVSSRGRTKARVAAYNRMSAVNQELLRRSGLRDSYLKGEATLKQARGALRKTAVSKGFAKPLRSKPAATISGTALDIAVAGHIVHELRQAGHIINPGMIHDRVPHMKQADKVKAVKWKSAQIRAYAGDNNNLVVYDGEAFNPLWYHTN